MSSGDGEDNNPLNKALNQFANVSTQLATGLLSGINDKGKFDIKGGVAGHALDEGLGEITGRNLARDQAAAADQRVKAEDAKRTADLLAQQREDMVNDMQASETARASRLQAQQKAQADFTPAQDFLGL